MLGQMTATQERMEAKMEATIKIWHGQISAKLMASQEEMKA
jgi:hypothetical protein